MNRTHALPATGALIAAALAGYLFGVANTAPAGTAVPNGPVSVSVVHEESGELRSVELTDSNGRPVEVGSIAEEYPWLEDDGGEVDAQ
jgi:hypothetical protein